MLYTNSRCHDFFISVGNVMRTAEMIVCGLLLAVLPSSVTLQRGIAAEPNAKLDLQIPLAAARPLIRRTIGRVYTFKGVNWMHATLPREASPQSEAPDSLPVEGYYIGIVGEYLPSLVDARLLRVHLMEVKESGEIVAKIGEGAKDKLKSGETIVLVRPLRATTLEMLSVPDLVTIEEAPPQDAKLNEVQSNQMTRSIVNLRTIGRALYQYHDLYKKFPPAALNGPDGKPWHSWRVMILACFDEANQALYHKYRFDEPWDGPNNKQLLDSMPHYYTDQPPDKITDHFTRYAAVTGNGLAFSAEGLPLDVKRPKVGIGSGTKLREVIDGASNTLSVGTISSEEAIPWTKPADIVVGENLNAPVIGKKGGFAAPFRRGADTVALFGRLDGSVVGIRASIDPQDLHRMLTIAGRERFDWKTDAVFVPKPLAVVEDQPVIYLFEEKGQPKARLVR